jgi:hypothetical protein
MPFREKSAWVSLLTTSIVWGYYLFILIGEVASGAPDGARLMGLFSRCVIVIVVAQIVLSIVLAASSPKAANAPADERERMIGLRASHVAFATLSALALIAALSTPLLAVLARMLFPTDPLSGTIIVLGSAIFFAVVIAELVRAARQIILYHRLA